MQFKYSHVQKSCITGRKLSLRLSENCEPNSCYIFASLFEGVSFNGVVELVHVTLPYTYGSFESRPSFFIRPIFCFIKTAHY